MLMILARLVRSESFWAVVKVRSPHTGPEVCYTHWANRPISLPLNHHGPVTPSARGQRLPRAGP